jgi:hypothetical protein
LHLYLPGKQPIVVKFLTRLHTLEIALRCAVQFYSPQAEQPQLLGGCELNQSRFFNFLFNLFDVSAGNGVATEKFLHLTAYAQRKCLLWKSSGLGFEIYDFWLLNLKLESPQLIIDD